MSRLFAAAFSQIRAELQTSHSHLWDEITDVTGFLQGAITRTHTAAFLIIIIITMRLEKWGFLDETCVLEPHLVDSSLSGGRHKHRATGSSRLLLSN